MNYLKKSTQAVLLLAFLVISLIACESNTIESELDTEVYSSSKSNSTAKQALNQTYEVGKPSTNSKKVYMHYMPWFGDENTVPSDRHWAYGTVNEPIIGRYNSKSWATHLYHILLSAAVGVDGAVINVKTDYDDSAFEKFIESMGRIDAIYPQFEYDIAVSYDDNGAMVNSITDKMTRLRDSIIPSTNHYLHKGGEPVMFLFEYAGNLTIDQYRGISDAVFGEDQAILIKNDIDTGANSGEFIMNTYYPWIQPGTPDGVWPADGSKWGDAYLNWYYNTLVHFKDYENKAEFVVGGVWAGFDDRQMSSTDGGWSHNRYIDRRNGQTYEDTWNYINVTQAGNIDWVILETWNDFNEGTELEPIASSCTDSYQYVDLTAQYIEDYTGNTTLIDSEKKMFTATAKIYEAAKLIEDGDRDYNTFYPILESSIGNYLKTNGALAETLAEQIINTCQTKVNKNKS